MRFAIFMLILLISACSSSKDMLEERFSCPIIGFIKGSENFEMKDKNIKAKISDLNGECVLNDKNAELDMTVVFEAGMMKEAKIEDGVGLKYFISVIDNKENILSKKIFSTQLNFDNSGYSRVEEDHLVELPIKDVEDVAKYKVILGFVKEGNNDK